MDDIIQRIMSAPDYFFSNAYKFSKLSPFDNECVEGYKPSNDSVIQGRVGDYLIEACIASYQIPWRVKITCDIKNKKDFRNRCNNCPFAKYNGEHILQISPRHPAFFDLIKTQKMREVERIGKLVGLQRGLCRTYLIDVKKNRVVRTYVIRGVFDNGDSKPFAIFDITQSQLTVDEIYRLSLLLCSTKEGQKCFVCDRGYAKNPTYADG